MGVGGINQSGHIDPSHSNQGKPVGNNVSGNFEHVLAGMLDFDIVDPSFLKKKKVKNLSDSIQQHVTKESAASHGIQVGTDVTVTSVDDLKTTRSDISNISGHINDAIDKFFPHSEI